MGPFSSSAVNQQGNLPQETQQTISAKARKGLISRPKDVITVFILSIMLQAKNCARSFDSSLIGIKVIL